MKITVTLNEDEGFGEILELATLFGWEDTFPDASSDGDDYTPEVADGIEENAIDYLETKGVTIVYEEELEEQP